MATSRAKKSTVPALYAIYLKYRRVSGRVIESFWHEDNEVVIRSDPNELEDRIPRIQTLGLYTTICVVEIKGIPT